MRFLRTNTAVRLTVGPFLDKTDGVTPETALTVTSCKLTLVVDDANVPTLVLDTNPTASGGANDMVHITGDDAGFYDLELAAANVNYLGRAMLALTDAATHCPVFHEFMILPAMIYDSLVLGTDRLDANVTHVADTSQTARDIGASVLLSSGTGAGQISLTSGGVTLADGVSHGGTLGTSTATLALSRANINSQTLNASGISITGNGTGHGLLLTSGTGATGNGLTLVAASTNGHGLKSTGTGTGDGAELTAGASGADLDADIAGTITTATNVTTVNGLAANVITAAATAADFGTEVATAVWANGTRSLTTLAGLTVDTVTTLTNLPAITAGWLTSTGIAADAFTAAKFAADVTTELQSGLATAASIAALNNLSAAQVNAEVDTALADINLDHLIKIAVDTDFATTVHLSSVLGHIADNGTTATFDRTTDSLEAIRDRGDAAWTTATGFSTHSAADVWAVATRVLTAIDEDTTTLDLDATIQAAVDARFDAVDTAVAALPTANSIADQVWEETLADHSGTVGSTAAALNAAGGAGDPWATTLPGAYGAGTAGKIIGDNINATISSRASQTTLDTLDDFVDTEVAAIKAKTDNLPTDPADASDIAARFTTIDTNLATVTGYVDTEVATANTGITTLLNRLTNLRAQNLDNIDDFTSNVRLDIAALNNLSAAQVNTEVDTALADYDGPTNAEMVARTLVSADYATATALDTVDNLIDTEIGTIITHLTDIKGGTFDGTTDSLEAIRNRGDAAWITATGFSIHSASDVWAVATRTITGGTVGTLTTLPAITAGWITTAGIADGAYTEDKFTVPAEAGGNPTGLFGMIRRLFEWSRNRKTRDRDTGVVSLRNAANNSNLVTYTQSTAGTSDVEGPTS